jgi:hypothetical protein
MPPKNSTGKPTEGPPDVNDPTASFTAEDIQLYPRLCEVLRKKNLPLQAQCVFR